MKRTLARFAVLCLAVLLAAGLFSACADKTPVLEPTADGIYLCKKTGVSYRLVEDARLEAVSTGDAYGQLRDGDRTVTLYEVSGLSPERWLVTDSGSLYCEAGITPPTPEDMNITSIAICRTQTLTIPISVVTDRDTVAAVIDVLCAESKPKLSAVGVPESWRLKLESPDWEGICLSVILRYYEDGLTVYDKLTDEQAAEVEAALAKAEAELTEEEIAAGIRPEPKLPASYTPLTDDERVRVTLKKYTYRDADGNPATEWDVLYDYGNYFLFDRTTGDLLPLWDLLTPYIEGSEPETATDAPESTAERQD